MAKPVEFPSSTPAFALPLLFAGQAQKEFFINQALTLIDTILKRGVVESTNTAPSDPDEGSAYRILANANGVWAGHDDAIAVQIGGAWQFIAPTQGMAVFDQKKDQWLFFRTAWTSAAEQVPPTAGNVIDIEARAAIGNLISALRSTGLLPAA